MTTTTLTLDELDELAETLSEIVEVRRTMNDLRRRLGVVARLLDGQPQGRDAA
jgi:hypothetical protein